MEISGALILQSEIHVGWMVPGNPWEAMHRLGPKGLLLGAELLWADDAVEAAWADRLNFLGIKNTDVLF